MFWVNDTIKNRHAKIRAFASQDDILIGYLLAAADFEWTVRRAILGLGHRANKAIRDSLSQCHGLKAHQDSWKKEVYPSRKKHLPDIVPDWEGLCMKAFPLRHQLIHGTRGTPGVEFAKVRRDIYLDASTALVAYARAEGVDIYKRLPVRMKDR